MESCACDENASNRQSAAVQVAISRQNITSVY